MKKAPANEFPDDLIEIDDPTSLIDRKDGRPVVVFQAPKQSLLGRIATGLGCASVVAVLMNFGGVKWIVLHLFAAILRLYGGKGEPPSDHEHRPTAIDRIEKTAKEVTGKVAIPPTTSLPHARQGFVEAAKEKAADAAKAKVEEVAAPVREVASRIEGGIDKAADLARIAADKAAELQRKHEEAEKERLLVRAAELGLAGYEGWSHAKLRAEVGAAEKRLREEQAEIDRKAWLDRYNGRCPRCSKPMKVSRNGHSHYLCSQCGGSFTADRIRGMGPPPMPRTFGGLFR